MFTMPRRGIVNVKMVITEEKILSNIEKITKLINPNNKKQIIELDDNTYFRDLVESIKIYLIEYPKKKNFPKSIYDAAYQLVEYATNQFEDNTKQIEALIRQREYNIKTAGILKQSLSMVQSDEANWKEVVAQVAKRLPEDVVQALVIVGKYKKSKPQECQAAIKLINAKVVNLESNLHIEIDMERVEDRSKALSYIGIEIADALKLIPAPIETTEMIAVKESNSAINYVENRVNSRVNNNVQNRVPNNSIVVENPNVQPQNNAYQSYYAETRREIRESLWSRIKHSKFVQTIKYALRIRIILQLPEGTSENSIINK